MAVNKIKRQSGTLGMVYGPDQSGIKVDSSSKLITYRDSASTVKSVPADEAVGASTDQATRVAVRTLTGAEIHAGTGGVVAWTNPESVAIVVNRVVLDLTTASTGACTLDIGVTETTSTTTSDTLLDGIDANAAVAVFDSMNAALDSGANAKAQKLAAAKWVTIDEKSGDATGLVANLYIHYNIV